MIAKKVSESINFERGKDPLDSMDLGYFGKNREWSYRELRDAYIDLLIKSKGKEFRQEMENDLLKVIPGRLTHKAGWGNIDKIIYNLRYPDEFNDMKNVILKYYKMCK